jgi:hypothetical protein
MRGFDLPRLAVTGGFLGSAAWNVGQAQRGAKSIGEKTTRFKRESRKSAAGDGA